jgi:hypothetical protein
MKRKPVEEKREMLAVQTIELMTCSKNLQREWKGDLLTG